MLIRPVRDIDAEFVRTCLKELVVRLIELGAKRAGIVQNLIATRRLHDINP